MILDWNAYHQQLIAGIGQIGKISPDTLRGYRELRDAGSKTGKLDAKTRELIALGVAVTRQCDGCITVHTEAAVKHGATLEEITEALGVAMPSRPGRRWSIRLASPMLSRPRLCARRQRTTLTAWPF